MQHVARTTRAHATTRAHSASVGRSSRCAAAVAGKAAQLLAAFPLIDPPQCDEPPPPPPQTRTLTAARQTAVEADATRVRAPLRTIGAAVAVLVLTERVGEVGVPT